jgi:hypothetical protein
MNRSVRTLFSHTTALMVGIILAGLGTAVSAWTGPQNTPPSCVAGQTGCDTPLNTGSSNQVKNGGLSVNALSIYGDTLLNGGNPTYLNFGSTVGATGYGIRDNAGTIEYRNSVGVWTAFSAVSETDPQVGTLTANKWCTTDGTSVNCTTNAPVLAETDPSVGTLTNTKWCTTNGTTVNCTTAAPSFKLVQCSGPGGCTPTCPAGYTLVNSVVTGPGSGAFNTTYVVGICTN